MSDWRPCKLSIFINYCQMPAGTGWKPGFSVWEGEKEEGTEQHWYKFLIVNFRYWSHRPTFAYKCYFVSQSTYVWMLRAGYFDISLCGISTHEAPHMSSWSITVTLCWISPEGPVVWPSPYKVKFLYNWLSLLYLPIIFCWVWPPNTDFIGNFLFQWLSSLE